jgi:hypothetical protein
MKLKDKRNVKIWRNYEKRKNLLPKRKKEIRG